MSDCCVWCRGWCPPRLREAGSLPAAPAPRDRDRRERSWARYRRRPDAVDLTPYLEQGYVGVIEEVVFVCPRPEEFP